MTGAGVPPVPSPGPDGWGSDDEWLQLAQIGPRDFRVKKDLVLRDGGVAYTAPAYDETVPSRKWKTDLASVPFVVWGQIAPFGRQTRSALLHDYECWTTKTTFAGRRGSEPLRAREAVDGRFRRGLLHDGVPWLRAWQMWAGVSVQRVVAHARLPMVLAMLTHLAVGIVVIWWALLTDPRELHWEWALKTFRVLDIHWVTPWDVLSEPVASVALVAVVLALAALWGRGTRLAVLLVLTFGTLVLPVAVANLLVTALVAGLNALLTFRLDWADFLPTLRRAFGVPGGDAA